MSISLRFASLCIALLLAVGAPAQLRNPFDDPRHVDSEQIFDTSQLARIDIALDPDDLAALYADPLSDVEYEASMRFRNALLDESLGGVGVRFRGTAFSRNAPKKSWNIDINEFSVDPNRRFHGLRQFNLNSHRNDPSIIRGQLMMDHFRAEGLPAPRSHLTELWVNGEYLGVYVNVEEIDGAFLRAWFTSDEGNLWVCRFIGPRPDLTYVSDDPNAYKLLGAEGERTYELVTNEALDDYTALAHFIDVLNNTATEEFEAEFSAVFDVQTFLRQLAAEVAFGHWDGVWFFQNNFALYHLPETGLMYFIPFDVDNIMGINFFPHLIDVGTVDPLEFGIRNEPGLPEAHPLPDNVLAVGAWRDEFLQSFRDLMNGPVSLDVVAPRIDFLRDQIATSVQADPLYPLGAGYSYQTFLDSFDVATGGLATYGLREFLWWRAQEGFPAGLELR